MHATSGPTATDNPYDRRVAVEQIRRLYEQSFIATGGAVCCALLIGIFLTDVMAAGRVWSWVVAAAAVTLIRQAVGMRFRKSQLTAETAGFWKWLFIGLLLVSGIIWGASGVLLFPQEQILYQMLVFVALIAMVAGAATTFSVVFPAYFAFSVPALMPLIGHVFVSGDTTGYALGVVALLYLVFITLAAYHLNRQTQTVLALKFENTDLVQYLESAKNRTEAANLSLKSEIAERKKAEQALENHRNNLQDIVNERTAELERTNTELRKEIEERKKTESALKASEEKYRLLVENANDAICILQAGRIRFHNQRTETMLGYAGNSLQDTDYFNLIFPEDLPLARRLYRQRQNNEVIPPEHTIRLIGTDDSPIWAQVNAISVQWSGQPATLCIIRDITAQKRMEAQLMQSQKMEAIGNLAGGIAHDINNILSGIQGNISLMRMNTADDDPNAQKINDIESYINSGSGLTRQLLEFAQPAAPEVKPADLNGLLQNTIEMFRRSRKEIQVETDFSETDAIVDIDSSQIEQVVLNLLVNAWQAMPKGGTIDVRTEAILMDDIQADTLQLTTGHYIKTAITDTGKGIDPETLPKIFEPFFSTKSNDTGTGLGLSSAYNVIRNHGGHITAYSQPGAGTTFHIYLPASQQQSRPAVAAAEDEPIAPGTETLLIVDDEADILEIAREMLETLGYTVIATDSGKKAIDIYAAQKDAIDMVILDMIMSPMDGETVYERLRAVDPEVPVLLSSGYSKSRQADAIMEKGCNGFIQKPFNMQTLNRQIRQILEPTGDSSS
ncbi:MAG: ATP-binding protein [Thermodesulfobacteriota bacterium]